MAEQLGIFDIIGQVGEQLSKSGYLRDVGEYAQAGDFSGDVETASRENNRRVARAVKKGRMSPEYRRSQGIDPVKQDFAREQFKAKRDFFLANRPRQQFEQPDFDPAVFENGQGLVDAYDAVANETPQERMAINQPASLPSVPVDSTNLDYTGSVGVPEYTPEYVAKAVADVEAGRYSPLRFIQDAAYTAAKIPMTALQTGLEVGNMVTGGALDPLLNRYNEGQEEVKNMIASDAYLDSERQVQEAIQRRDLGTLERAGGVLGAMIDNPLYAASTAAQAFGSTAVPLSIAKLANMAKGAKALAPYARFIPSAETASEIGNVAMNMGGTFSDEEMQKQSLADRYLGAGVSGLGTFGIGRVTEGGAEGQIARMIGNEGRQAEGTLLGSVGKESLQEGFEGASDYTGKALATGKDINVSDMIAEQIPDMIAGGIMGGGSHIGTRLANAGRAMQQAENQDVTNQIADSASTGNLVGAVLDAVQKANPPAQQTAPKPQPKPVQQKAAEPAPAPQPIIEQPQAPVQASNPVDVIRSNGGLSRETLADMGWNDNDIAKLPSGIVADKGGMSLAQAQDVLTQSGNDNDVEALVDYASRPQYAPEQEEQEQPNIFGQTNEVPSDWKSWVDSQLQQNPVGQTESKQAEPAPAQSEQKQLTRADTQNRDRSSKQSIAQMNSIAGNPDYGRLGASNDFGNGAPVVYGDMDNVIEGNSGTMVASDGRRIPFRYGLVEADNLISSNLADGTPVPEYDTGAKGKLRAIAGNGRTAGIKEAYNRGTAGKYSTDIYSESNIHGISSSGNLRQPVLVRIMNEKDITPDLADVSNTATNAVLTPLEQAKNDARRIDISSLDFDEKGVSMKNVKDFIKSLPMSEQTALLAKNGEPTRQATDRLMAAVFATAYESDGLADLYMQSSDEDVSRNVLNALGSVAHKFAQMKDMGEFDIRPMVVRAAEDVINARKNGKNLTEYASNQDFTREPEADIILKMMATNIRSGKRIAEALENLADGMIGAYNAQGSMFGDSPTREQAFNNWRNNYGDEQGSEAGVPEQGRTEYAPENDAGQIQSERTQADTEETARPEQEEQPEEGLTLEQATPEQIKADEEKAKAEAKRKADEAKKAEQKAKADEEVGNFSLSGSDSQEDILIGQGQGSMFDNQGDVEKKEEPKTAKESVTKDNPVVRSGNVVYVERTHKNIGYDLVEDGGEFSDVHTGYAWGNSGTSFDPIPFRFKNSNSAEQFANKVGELLGAAGKESGQTEQKAEGKNSLGIPLENVTEFNTVTRKALNEALSALANQDLDNDLEGVKARVGSKHRGKLQSSEARTKSEENGYTSEQHYGIASKIKEAWRWSAKVREEKHKSGEKNATAEKYVAAVRIGKKDGFAFITVIKSHAGRRIYSVELMSKEKLGGTLSAPSSNLVDRNAPSPSLEEIISKLSGEVKKAETSVTEDNNQAQPEEKQAVTQKPKKSRQSKKVVFDSKLLDTESDTYKKAVEDEFSEQDGKSVDDIKKAVAFYKNAVGNRQGKPADSIEDIHWYHGRLAGAERALKESENRNDTDVDNRQKPAQSEESLNGREYESIDKAVDKMRKGEIAVDDLKRIALEALDNEESVKAGLNRLTIAQLKPMVPFYTRGKKSDYVNAAYDQLLFELLPVDSFSTMYGGGQTFQQQYTDKVNSLTQEDIKTYSGKLKEKRDARQKALTNPETLDEFRTFNRAKGYDALTSKQKAVYDDLLATERREKAQQEKAKPEPRQKKTASVVSGNISAEIVETKHTKTGETLHVVKLGDKTESDVFKSLRGSAKENNGYYSRFVKGFLFTDRTNAESFLKVVNDMSAQEQSVQNETVEEQAEQPVSRSVERMREVAQANIDRAEAKLNADRNTNTARRARIASGIEEDARRELRRAKTMLNIADAIESGSVRHLADITTMTQVELLDRLLSSARSSELIEKYPNYPERLKQDYEAVSDDTVGYAKYPTGENWTEERKRLERAGINDLVMLRAALREYATLRSDRVERDKVKDAERAIVGRKVGEDFFPTPPAVASRMAEMAGISDGDRVLEPSAGSGNLADAAKQAGGSVDAIEIDGSLRNILDAKGHDVVAEDFMDYEPSEKYDVVIMNPPFSNRRDAEHIMRAFDMLKDGGRLVAIAGEGVFFGRDKKAEAFRTWLDNHGAYIEKLPENTFSDKKLLNTTGANARLIKITKRADAQYATRAMPSHDAYSTVDEVVESLKADKANNAAIVVQSVSDLPAHLREQAEERDPETIEGVYDPEEKKPYLIADNITDPERALEVARHEVIAHYGIEGMLGEERMNEIADKVTDALKRGIKVIKEYSDRVNETHGELDERTHAKEIIAKMSEDGIQNSVTRRVWNAIKSFLNSIGLGRFDMTEKEVADILREARQAVIDRGQDMVGGQPASESFSSSLFSKDAPRNQYEKDLRDVLRGSKKNPINMGKPSSILQSIGFPDKPFMLKKAVINKVMREDKHAITEEDLRKIPSTLNEPMMVFKSDTRDGSFVVVTGEVDSENRPIVVTVNPDGNIVRISSNEITSIYGKDKFSDSIERWVGEGLLLGAQKENVAGWLTIEKAQTPKMVQDITSDNVINIPSTRKPGKALFSINGNTKPISNQAQTAFNTQRHEWEVSDPTLIEDARRYLQDNFTDVKRVQEAIGKDSKITERENVYLKQELYASRLDARNKELDKDWIAPIKEAAKDTGMTIAQIDKWLAARHILLDKVNEKLADMNPNHPDKDRLAGMSDEEAQTIFHTGAGNKALYKVAELVDKLTRRTLQQRVVNGLMTKAEADHWRENKKHYVPLSRDRDSESQTSDAKPKGRISALVGKVAGRLQKSLVNGATDGNTGSAKSKGYQVRGRESQRRMGSTREIKNVLATVFADARNVARRVEQARVGRALLDLARNHPNDDFWTVDIPKKVLRVDKETGFVEMTYVGENKSNDNNVFVVKENGQEHWVTFNPQNERAMRVAKAMKNLDAEQASKAMIAIGRITRYMSAWTTQLNPEFVSSNFARDVQDAVFNLSSTPISGKEGQLVKTIPSAMKAIWQMEKGEKNSNPEMERYANEFHRAGGETGYIESYGTINEQTEQLEKELRELAKGKHPMKQVFSAMGNVIERANSSVENATRLSAFVVARKNGLSLDESASIAKNITVNFNRRGNATGTINALYMFANANIQGHARMLQAISKSRKAQVIAGVLVAASYALSLMSRSAMGDLWDDIPSWEKENNWIVPLGDSGNFFKCPIGPGLKLFHFVGTEMEQAIHGSDKVSMIDIAIRLGLQTIDNFNVFGQTGELNEIIWPTSLRPVIQVLNNKKFSGTPIHADSVNLGGYDSPAYLKAFSTTPKHWTGLSKLISNVTGGDEIKPGYLNWAPESIAHIVKGFVLPGTINMIDRSLTAIENAAGDKKITVNSNSLPIVNRFFNHVDEGQNYARLKKKSDEWRKQFATLQEYNKAEESSKSLSERARKYLAEIGGGNSKVGYNMWRHWNPTEKEQKTMGYVSFQKQLKTINNIISLAKEEGDNSTYTEMMRERNRMFSRFEKTGDVEKIRFPSKYAEILRRQNELKKQQAKIDRGIIR